MKKYFKDYKALCKHCGKFYKDHWFGSLMFTTIGFGLLIAPIAIKSIKDHKEFEKKNLIVNDEKDD